ncbi:RodZ domain-containing protein [Oceanisphaera avium]|uniref:HTH cro/C1-type domain-containing protein n=1 Tax=Oceanisphaera avium TaxID=1903694 RepID=A0A1Y0CV07_9GAMM|nr:RodZ domain-containing protein [Oceanisphaera avium]ART78756.1 hypothetical protein CBP12_00155 [Oceanisphaera avium]
MITNDTDSQPQADVTLSSGPGSALRQAREAKGWTQVDVARRLNLRLAVIESIDSDNYKAGVALTFLRGYVKAYAKVVGVPEAQALAAFDSMSHEQFKSAVPMKSFSKKTRQQASDKWLKRISWLVFLGLLSSLIYWWWHEGANQQDRQLQPDREVSTSAPSNDTDRVLSPDDSVLSPAEGPVPSSSLSSSQVDEAGELPTEPIIDGSAPADEGAVNEPAAEINDSEETDDAAVSPPANARLLSLSFSDDCWIKITDSQGKVLSEGVKKAEQSLALEGEPPFKLILGVPSAVRLEYLNEKVDLSSFNAGRAARLTVPKS